MGKKDDNEQIEAHRKKLAELKKATRDTISRVQEAVVRAEQISAKIQQEASKDKSDSDK